MLMIPGMMVFVCASVCDIRTRRIPVSVMAAGAVCVFLAAVAAAAQGYQEILRLFLAGMPGALLLLIAFLSREAIGYGDGLLMLCMGPVFGPQRTLLCVTAAFFISAVTSVVLLAAKRADRYTRMPFVPFLAFAMGVSAIVYG